jgi:hypothetical protein
MVDINRIKQEIRSELIGTGYNKFYVDLIDQAVGLAIKKVVEQNKNGG